MKNELTVSEEAPIASAKDGIYFNERGFARAMEAATFLATSDLVPGIYNAKMNKRGEKSAIANCMIALSLSSQIDVDPLVVMQNVYVINGNPAMEAKLLIALANASGIFKTDLNFSFEGEGDGVKCKCWAYKKSGELCEEWSSITMAKKEGWYGKRDSKWQSLPRLMLKYRAASFFCKVYCPGLMFGMQTAEEASDIKEVSSEDNDFKKLKEALDEKKM